MCPRVRPGSLRSCAEWSPPQLSGPLTAKERWPPPASPGSALPAEPPSRAAPPLPGARERPGRCPQHPFLPCRLFLPSPSSRAVRVCACFSLQQRQREDSAVCAQRPLTPGSGVNIPPGGGTPLPTPRSNVPIAQEVGSACSSSLHVWILPSVHGVFTGGSSGSPWKGVTKSSRQSFCPQSLEFASLIRKTTNTEKTIRRQLGPAEKC